MKKIIIFALAAVLFLSGTIVGASSARQEVKAYLAGDVKVSVDNELKQLKDANGSIVFPILYNGSTYLPVRSVSSLLGATVSWNEKTATVELLKSQNTASDTYLTTGTKIKYNDELITIKDSSGNALLPIIKDGEIYLPLTSLSKSIDMPVQYDRVENTIYVGRMAKTGTPDKWLNDMQVMSKSDGVKIVEGKLKFNDGSLTTKGVISITANESINSIVFPLNSGYKTLSGKLGISDLTKNNPSSAWLYIYGDNDELLYTNVTNETVDTNNSSFPHKFSIDISNVNKLQIIVVQKGKTFGVWYLGDLSLFK